MSDNGSEDSGGEDGRARERRSSSPALHAFSAGEVPEGEHDGEGPAEPAGYGEDRLEAIVRSPSSLFIYWDLSGPESARVRQAAREGEQWVLRLTDAGSGRRSERPVDPRSRNYYMRVEPGRTYVAELGMGVAEAFRTVCRTREVQMPPGGAGGASGATASAQEGPLAAGASGFAQQEPRTAAFEQKGPSAPPGAETLPGLTFEPSLLEGGHSSGAPPRRE